MHDCNKRERVAIFISDPDTTNKAMFFSCLFIFGCFALCKFFENVI